MSLPAHEGAITAGIEPVSAKRQAELIRTFDSEANFRTLIGPVGLFVTTLAVVLSSFHVYTAGFGLLDEIKHRSFHLTLVLALCFLVFPRERVSDDPRKAFGPWTWGVVFGAFYVYLAWALVDRVGLAGTPQGMAFVALIAFIAFISLPIQRFGGLGDAPSWVDWPLAAAAASISLYF